MSINICLYERNVEKLKLDSSLNRKLIQNENKFQRLLSLPKKKTEKNNSLDKEEEVEEDNEIDKEIYDGDEDKEIINKKINNYTDKKIVINFKAYYNNNSDGNDFEVQKLSRYFSPKNTIIKTKKNIFDSYKNCKNIIEVNRKFLKPKKVKNKSASNSTINLHTSKNKYFNKKVNGNKNNLKKAKLNNLNNYNHLKIYSTIDYTGKSDRCFSPSNKKVNFEGMIERFKKEENKRKEWLEKERKKKGEEEKKMYRIVPKMNKKSKKIYLQLKNDFNDRQKIKMEEIKKKEELLKEFLNKTKEEEINKNNNNLLNKKIKSQSNTSIASSKTNVNTVNSTINKKYDLDSKRREKINQKGQKKVEKTKNINHIRKFNKRSASMTELKKIKYREKNIFNRLDKNAKNAPQIVQKKKLLADLYTPSLQPKINKNNINNNKYIKKESKNKNGNNANKENKENKENEEKEEDEENKKDEEDEENEENEEEEEENEEKIKRKDFKGNTMQNMTGYHIKDSKVQQLFRDAIFHTKKKNV